MPEKDPTRPPIEISADEWNTSTDQAVQFLDGGGNTLQTFSTHYELDQDSQELKPAHPPTQPDADKVRVIRHDGDPVDGSVEEIIEEIDL